MAYRIAKSALNQGAVTMAREWEQEGRKVTMVCVEPGFLSTRLTGWDGEDNMDTCIAGLMKVFNALTPQDNGAFIKWDGNRIPF
jgi:NAD(P)-dependent dehydrogenase (short-subunit alcohol dehydrogenase family)